MSRIRIGSLLKRFGMITDLGIIDSVFKTLSTLSA